MVVNLKIKTSTLATSHFGRALNMSFLSSIRKKILQQLWQNYQAECPQVQKILETLSFNLQKNLVLDHFAMIELPGPETGISTLNQILNALNYFPQGRDYLEDKQNEFLWLAPMEARSQSALEADPQIVIADFRLKDLDPKIARIINFYSAKARPFPWQRFHELCGEIYQENSAAEAPFIQLILEHLQHRTWPKPSLRDYYEVREYNELLAWVLLCGRKINHFGINVECLNTHPDLETFTHWIQKLGIPLNQKKGIIQGDSSQYLAQSSTQGELLSIFLEGESVGLHGPFLEFVWRAPLIERPERWKDSFRGLIGKQANQVIEAVYR